jgi:hypothetical protein
MLKAIHASEDIAAAREKALQVVAKLRASRLTKAAKLVETGVAEGKRLPDCGLVSLPKQLVACA